ncbi:MAG: hypothetical protein Q8L78_00005 [Coxiellaceae bacterium]|nr:hypothetical protein [Coxiellaceae bacterium]
MKRIILLATIALSAVTASAVFADTQAMPDCHQHCKAAFQHCKTLAKHSDARKACFKKAKADKKACKINMSKPAASNQPNNNTQTASNTPAPAAAPQQPATAQ